MAAARKMWVEHPALPEWHSAIRPGAIFHLIGIVLGIGYFSKCLYGTSMGKIAFCSRLKRVRRQVSTKTRNKQVERGLSLYLWALKLRA